MTPRNALLIVSISVSAMPSWINSAVRSITATPLTVSGLRSTPLAISQGSRTKAAGSTEGLTNPIEILRPRFTRTVFCRSSTPQSRTSRSAAVLCESLRTTSKPTLPWVHGGNSFNFEVTNSHNASWVNQNCTSRENLLCADVRRRRNPVTRSHHRQSGLLLAFARRHTSGVGLEYRLDRYRIEAGDPYSYESYDGGIAAAGIQVFPGFRTSNEVTNCGMPLACT